jgi:hypothetical protein
VCGYARKWGSVPCGAGKRSYCLLKNDAAVAIAMLVLITASIGHISTVSFSG